MGKSRPGLCPLTPGSWCYEEKCAWWNHIDEECSVATLGTLATIDIGGAERKREAEG